MKLNSSVWNREQTEIRMGIVFGILQQKYEPMKMLELARMVCVVAEEYDLLMQDEKFHDSKYRRILTDDIAKINQSSKYPAIIVHGTAGVKVGTKDEAKEYVYAQFREAFRKVYQTQKMAKKIYLDGQFTLTQETVEYYGKE